MYDWANQSSEHISERSPHYALLHASLGTDSGEANLEDASQTHQVVVARPNQVSTAYFSPEGPMASRIPYIQPPFQYRQPSQPVQTLGTSRNTYMENVSVKDG
jgi:hypothetical protein